MLYLAIPAHNEAATIGVLLWRLRTVLAEFPREYEAVVYDDASSDSTTEILESYARVMPLTVIRGDKSVGYAGAVDALVRHIARQTRYPRRDAMLLLQGDFTDPPAMVPEFIKRFEGGADLVVGERAGSSLKAAPLPVRRMQRATGWMLRLLVKAQGVRDVTSSYRLIRISVLRDLLRNVGDAPVCAGDSQTSNADFLLQLIPLARRVETIAIEPTWGVRIRETRLVAMRDGLALARWAWRSRGRRAVASTAPDTASDAPRTPRPARSERDGSNVLPFESAESPRSVQPRGANVPTSPRKPRPTRTPFVAVDTEVDGATPLASARTRPPRRKRSRTGNKDGSSLEPSTEREATAPNSVLPLHQHDVADDDALPPSIKAADNDEPAAVFREPLSPALSEAAEAAEAEFDGEAEGTGRPPRKRRRRRGGRNRNARGASDAAEADVDESEESETELFARSNRAPRDIVAPDGEASPYGTERDVNEHRETSDGGHDAGDAEDEADGTTGEGRARRRGRRGRRGGSRRNRAGRSDAGESADGASRLDESGNEPTNSGSGE